VVLIVIALVALAPAEGSGRIGSGVAAGRPTPPSAGQVLTDEGGHTVDGPTGQEFVAHGTTWPGPVVTYGFVNRTADLPVAAQEAAIERALATWASVTPLRFERAADCGYGFNDSRCPEPDIRISFGSGSHAGSGDPAFDGPGGTVAHAYYPPPNGITAAGDVHLDDAETWTTTGGGVDLETIALHELGHSLGLAHATTGTCGATTGANRSIMCSSLSGTDRTLAPDDIAGIQSLYGPPENACGGYTVTVDLGAGGAPTPGADVIRGTDGPDVIDGLGGNDVICAARGDDVVNGGPGADRLIGGGGGDVVRGGRGPDTLRGGAGVDRCVGGQGRDVASSCERRRGVP
jgi:hypothetical protein